MSINGLPSTSASATPQRLSIFTTGQRYAFINDGSSSIFLRYSTGPVGDFAGLETELRAATFRAAEVKPGECMNKTVTTPTVDVVCGTGKTSTLRIFSGELGINLEANVSLGALIGLEDTAGVAVDPSAAYAEDTAHASGHWVTPTGAVRTDTRASLAGTTGDYAPLQLTANGDARVRDDDALTQLAALVASLANLNDFTFNGLTPDDLECISITQAGAGDAVIHADTAGSHFLLMGLFGTCDADGTTLALQEADGTPVYTGPMEFNDNNGLALPVTGFRYVATASGKGLRLACANGGFDGAAIILEIVE